MLNHIVRFTQEERTIAANTLYQNDFNDALPYEWLKYPQASIAGALQLLEYVVMGTLNLRNCIVFTDERKMLDAIGINIPESQLMI